MALVDRVVRQGVQAEGKLREQQVARTHQEHRNT